MSELVLLTSEETPIYHNPSPTDPDKVDFQQRWKGKVLLEFYETGQYEFWEDGKFGEPKKELARYIVVWDGQEPRTLLDGAWVEKGKAVEALLAPGTTEEIREAFRSWVSQNPHVSFGRQTLDIDKDVEILPDERSLDKAKEDMGTLFDSYLNDLVS